MATNEERFPSVRASCLSVGDENIILTAHAGRAQWLQVAEDLEKALRNEDNNNKLGLAGRYLLLYRQIIAAIRSEVHE